MTRDDDNQSLPPGAADQIDLICDRFEADLKSGRRPDLALILRQVPNCLREALLQELILVGLDYVGTVPNLASTSSAATVRPVTASDEHSTIGTSAASRTTKLTAGSTTTAVETPANWPAIDGYILLEELGRGGMGIVYRAKQVGVDRLVALKVIQCNRFDNSDPERCAIFLERFRTEAKAASRLDHANIATVFEIGCIGDAPFYTMRLVEGESLASLIQAGPLPAHRAVRYLLAIARMVDRLHLARVVHRDLKPSNVIIERATDIPIVTDFGLAKVIDDQQQVTLSDEACGSPPYMAPEQVLHATSVTGAADIYGLGATLYHLLTGRPPFQADSLAEIARQIVFCEPLAPRSINPAIPRDLETICLKCLEKDEFRRYATAGDLADDLQRFVDVRPIAAKRTGVLARTWRLARRNPTGATLVAAFFVALVCLALSASSLYQHHRIAADANVAIEANQRNQSAKLLEMSGFVEGQRPDNSLPWLIGCMKLDSGTSREHATRQRINSVLKHGADLESMLYHDGPISSAEFNTAGNCALTAGSDRTARLWSVKTGKCLRAFSHESALQRATFSRRGDKVGTAADDGVFQIWKTESGEKLGPPLIHPGRITAAVFSSDDKCLVIASTDNLVRFWNCRDGSLTRSLNVGPSDAAITCFAISPDGSRGFSSCGGSDGLIWSSITGEIQETALVHADLLTDASFGSDSCTIVTAGKDGKAKVWNAQSGSLQFECAHQGPVTHARLTPTGEHLVTATNDAIHVWRSNSLESGPAIIPLAGLKEFILDPTGAAVLAIDDAHQVTRWRISDGKALGAPFFHAGKVRGAHFSSDGSRAITFSVDGTARIWSTGERLRKQPIAQSTGDLTVNATPDGQWILAWTEDDAGVVFRTDEPDHRVRVFEGMNRIIAACISTDGGRVAAANVDGQLTIWDRDTAVSRYKALPLVGRIRALAFAPDTRTIAIGDDQGKVVLCDVNSLGASESFKLPNAVVTLAFDATGRLLLAADETAVRILEPGALETSDAGKIDLGGAIRGAHFSPNGSSIAVFGKANRALVFDIAAGSLKTLRTNAAVVDARFSPHSNDLLVVTQEGVGQLWHVANDRLASNVMKHATPLTLCAISPDGQLAVICDDNYTARVWELHSGLPITIPLRHSDRIVHAQFVSSERVLTITASGNLYVADLEMASADLEELDISSIVRTGLQFDDQSGVAAVLPAEIIRRCHSLYDRTKN